ncbi:MAG: sensor histidine kinase [Acidobacteriota bacterium]
MLRSSVVLVTAVALLLAGSSGAAFPPDRSADSEAHALPVLERLGTEHGLSHNTVNAILEDRHGFLWFATQNGLNRYDGRDFVAFGHDASAPGTLGSSIITALHEDRQGRLLVGTRAGLYRLAADGQRFEHLALGGPASTGAFGVTTIAESADGRLWVGADGALFSFDAALTRPTPVAPIGTSGAASWNHVRAIRNAPDGSVWVLEEDAFRRVWLVRVSDPALRHEVGYAWSFGFSAKGEVWIDPRHRAAPEVLAARRLPGLDGVMTAQLADTRGRLWVGTLAGLLVKESSGDALRRVQGADLGLGALTHEITAIIEDRVGTVWVGTFGGVLRFDPHAKPFRRLAHREGDPASLASNAVSGIVQDASGAIWVATFGDGLDQVDRASGHVVHHRSRPDDPHSVCGDYIWDIAASSRVTLWVGTNASFCSFARGRFTRHPLPAAAESALSLHESPDGTLWIGATGGLYRYLPGLDRVELVGNAASGWFQPVGKVYQDGVGRIWFASARSGDLGWYDPASGASRVFRGVGREGIWDLHEGAPGELWLATGTGLARFDALSSMATDAELSAGAAPAISYSVQADASGRLWLGTSRGLVRYDPRTQDYREYEVHEGPGHVEFNRHAAHRTASGELFFGGMHGITSFVPENVLDNPHRPPVVLTMVRVFGDAGERRHGPLEALTLRPGDRSVAFEFAALNFTDGRKNRYAYTLEGFDRDWTAAGAERAARYTSLPAGQYTFRVRGSNNDGVWSDREVALPVLVVPPFWQTWWFRSIALAMLAGALLVAHRLRTAHLVGLERLRLRIASDLHDDLGSELSGIALASGLVARQEGLTERDRQRLMAVSTSAAKVMDGLRDVIWTISPEHDTLESMERRMREVAQTLLADHTHEFHAFGLRTGVVPMRTRRHLFLIYKELLHNIVRHARARHVRIVLDASSQALRLVVADDGRGDAGATAGGTGLRSIRRRAREVGAETDIRSEPNEGTTCTVVVPMTRTRGSRRGRNTDRVSA